MTPTFHVRRIALRHRHVVGSIAVSALMAVFLGACSSITDTDDDTLTTTEANAVGASVAADISTAAVSMTTDDAASAGGALTIATASSWMAKGCGVASPTPITDSDGDGVPDSVTVTYAVPACSYVGRRGLTQLDVTGSLTLTDPTRTTADHSLKTTATALRFAFTRAGVTYSETRDGTRTTIGSSTQLSQTNDMTSVFATAGTTVGTLSNTLAANFTPQTGSTIVMGQPLPNGTFSINGSLTWTTPSITDAFTITTVTPLAYDATCAATSASPFKSGEIRATATGASRRGTIRIVWQNCADPQVVLVVAS